MHDNPAKRLSSALGLTLVDMATGLDGRTKSRTLPASAQVVVSISGAVALVGLLELIRPQGHVLVLALVGALTVLQLVSLQHGSGELIPFAIVPIAVLNLVGITGYYFYVPLARQAAVSAALPETSDVYHRALSIFATASLCIWVGTMIVVRGRRRTSLAIPTAPRNLRSGLLLLAATVPLLLTVQGRGLGALIVEPGTSAVRRRRPSDRPGSYFYPSALPPRELLDKKRGEARVWAGLLLIAYLLLYFALGTRGFGLVPVLLLVSALLAGRRPGARSIVAVGLLSLFLLQLPLAMRSHDGANAPAGLSPYWGRVSAQPTSCLCLPASTRSSVTSSFRFP